MEYLLEMQYLYGIKYRGRCTLLIINRCLLEYDEFHLERLTRSLNVQSLNSASLTELANAIIKQEFKQSLPFTFYQLYAS